MKKQIIALTLICALTLTACSKGETAPDADTSSAPQTYAENTADTSAPKTEAPDTEAAEEKTENTENAEEADVTEDNVSADPEIPAVPRENYPDYLYGPGGDKVSADEITEINCYIAEDKWNYAVCDGFTYISEPTGIGFNGDENPDLFDNDNFVFKGAPASSAEYKRYSVGASICGLTVKEATARFYNENNPGDIHREGYFQGGSVRFDGTMELIGYLIILTDDEYAVGFVGDIVFIPDNESQVLPILNYNRISEEKGVYSDLCRYGYSAAGFAYQSEYPCIDCGNVDEYDSSMFAAVEHNNPTHVRITAEDIVMSSSVGWFANMEMSVRELEVI